MYVPLLATELEVRKVQSQSTESKFTLSWSHQNFSNGYIVAMGDDNCTAPDRSPPCFLVHNTVSFISCMS